MTSDLQKVQRAIRQYVAAQQREEQAARAAEGALTRKLRAEQAQNALGEKPTLKASSQAAHLVAAAAKEWGAIHARLRNAKATLGRAKDDLKHALREASASIGDK